MTKRKTSENLESEKTPKNQKLVDSQSRGQIYPNDENLSDTRQETSPIPDAKMKEASIPLKYLLNLFKISKLKITDEALFEYLKNSYAEELYPTIGDLRDHFQEKEKIINKWNEKQNKLKRQNFSIFSASPINESNKENEKSTNSLTAHQGSNGFQS